MSELATAAERLLTPDDVAKRLAVSRSMAYTLINRGELRALRVGRLPRITEAALAEYLAAALNAGAASSRQFRSAASGRSSPTRIPRSELP